MVSMRSRPRPWATSDRERGDPMSVMYQPRPRRRTLNRLAVSVAAVCALILTPAVAHASSADQATAYQLDPAHDGYQTGTTITTPLSQAWSVTLPGSVSYPLIVNGVIYVTASNQTLYAIQQATGATLWSHNLGGTYDWSGLAYDAGQVFAINYSGSLSAFNAQTGATDWSASMPGQYAFSSAPTAYNGIVYVGGAGSGGTVYAVSESNGAVLWTQPVENGDHSSPAVSSSGVYVTYACGQDYDFSPISGTLIWHHSGPCEGGGGKTPVLANGTIFGRDSSDGDLILSATTGAQQATFGSATAPAVGGGDAYTISGGTLTAVSSSGEGSNAWTATGDGHFDSAPLIADGLVLEGSSAGMLYALDPGTGATDWSGNVGAGINAPDEQNVSAPLTGLGAGENTVVVPAGSNLVAYTGANLGSGTPTNTFAPSVAGQPQAGHAVGGDVGVWTALPTSYTYQWSLCDSAGSNCSIINGATSEAYAPPTADIGDTLEVAITATNGNGTASAVTSPASAQIVASPPVSVTAPTIGGNPAVGQTLTVSNGTWANSPTSYTYQWLSCTTASSCTIIPGATANTFVVTASQAGYTLEAQVVASNGTGPSPAATSPLTSAVPMTTTLTLTSSANPVQAGAQVKFTAVLARPVDGGSISFYENGQPIPGCGGLALTSGYIGAYCTVPSITAGTWTITAQYGGDADYLASSSNDLTETVNATSTTSTTTTTTAKAPPAPPSESVGKAGPKDKPNLKLTLTAVRTSIAPYRYWFALKNVKCINKASAVLVTYGKTTMAEKCTPKIQFASKSLAVHRYYTLTLRAVRYGKKHKVVARGAAYHEKLYMPGNEVQWTPIIGLTPPEIAHLANSGVVYGAARARPSP